MTEHEGNSLHPQEGMLGWLQQREKIQVATAEFKKFLNNEFNLDISTNKVLPRILGAYVNVETNHKYTYQLLINEKANSIDLPYLSLLTTSSLLLGQSQKEPAIIFPFPLSSSISIIPPHQIESYNQTLLLSNDLLNALKPELWDEEIQDVLNEFSPSWKSAAVKRGNEAITFIQSPPIQAITPTLEERLNIDILALSSY